MRKGTIYLLHFDRPYKHARHYVGYTRSLRKRLALHAAGQGARLLAVARAAGITWQLVRTWQPATQEQERRIKNNGHIRRHCPICRGEK